MKRKNNVILSKSVGVYFVLVGGFEENRKKTHVIDPKQPVGGTRKAVSLPIRRELLIFLIVLI